MKRIAEAAFLRAAVYLKTGRVVMPALALLVLLAQLYLLNQAAIPVYHDWMLSTAMRADFRRFYGMAQWLGWCWPWLALLLLARRTLKPPR